MAKKFPLFLISLIFIAAAAEGYFYFYKKSPSGDKNAKPVNTEQAAGSKVNIKPLSDVILMTDKTVYQANDLATSIIVIHNPFPEIKKWRVIYYFKSADGSFSELGQTKSLELKPGQTAKQEFTTSIDRSLLPGQYKVITKVEERGLIINAKSLAVEVRGTQKMLEARLKFCADINCGMEKNVFLSGQTAYLKIISPTADLISDGRIKFPESNNWQILKIQSGLVEMKLDKIGAYEVDIKISRTGYQELDLKKILAVIAQEPEIKSASRCNGDGQCDSGETAQNCPQDCK